MKEAFEMILEKLEDTKDIEHDDSVAEVVSTRIWNKAIHRAKQIVKEVEEEYNGGWISCSDRLPEESGTYIVNAIENSIIHVTFAKWMPRMKKWNLTGCRSYWKVNAWQPLPEPYKERY